MSDVPPPPPTPDAQPDDAPSEGASHNRTASHRSTPPGNGDPASGLAPAHAVLDDRRLVFYSLLTGLCPLIPAPFVDDWVRDRIRRRLIEEMANEHAPDLGNDARDHLARGPSQSFAGCMRGCATGAPVRMVVYVVSKLFRSTFRKIFFFLALKDAGDTFSRTLHEGHLLRLAFEQGWVSGQADATVQLRQAVVDACDDVDTGAIQRVARGVMTSSRRLLRRGARLLSRSRFARRQEGADATETLAQEEALLGDVIDDMTVELNRTSQHQPNHWSNLRRAFEKRLSARDAGPGGIETTASP